jgi:hypothetical protein
MNDSPSDRPVFRPLIRSQADLERMWRRLMTPLGFSGCSLWMVMVEDDRPVPKIMQITELPDSPEDRETEALARVLALVAAPGTRFAFLRSRPGGGRPTPGDRAWALALYDAGRRAGARLDVVHLAHDQDVLPLAMDDLVAESA